MKFIELTNSTCFASVDDDDYERIKALNTDWRLSIGNSSMYIKSTRKLSCKGAAIYLHRFILDLHNQRIPSVDHTNRDIFNNRKENLRQCSLSQNMSNRQKPLNNTSGYLGVSFVKKYKLWMYKVTKNGIQHSKYCFATAKEAAVARDEIAKRLHGKFAVLNFPAGGNNVN